MTTSSIDENSVVFNSQGIMHCGLKKDKYNLIIIKPFDFSTLQILKNICKSIDELYSHDLIESEKLVIRLDLADSARINNLTPLFEFMKDKNYRHFEFVNKNLHYNPTLEKMLQEKKASLCFQMKYGEKLDTMSVRNLKTYLEKAKDKENINVHCIINDIYSVNDKGIQDFIRFMYKIGINTIGLRFDSKYLSSNLYYDFPENLKYIFANFFKTAKKYSFIIDVKDKEQNELLRRICKIKKRKKVSLKKKFINFILQKEDDYEI